MKNIADLVKEINVALSKFDSEIIESDIRVMKAAADRVDAVKAEHKLNPPRNEWVRYDALFAAAGGKGNYNVVQYGWGPAAERAVRKSSARKIEARNAKIAAKLLKLGADAEVKSGELLLSCDGFNGYFDINCGEKSYWVKIDTIFAGGYNIQCAHLRCLVNVRAR